LSFQSFEELLVWQRGKALAVEVCQALAECRHFALKDQMQRAAISIPSNIAEGYERTPKEFARFLSIAIGSCSELRTQMYIAVELNVLPAEQAAKTIDETKQLNRMMRALAKAQYNKINEIRETPKQYNLESEP
jgi:four helix bundle protein